jgi:multisubunit Na+/H+ antiporter MnhB subunit
MLPPPRSLGEQLMRTMFTIGVLLPNLNYYRQAFNGVQTYAISQATVGDGAEALTLMAQGRRIAAMAAAQSRVLVELLVANGIYENAIAGEAMIYKLRGDQPAFEQVVQRIAEQRKVRRAITADPVHPDIMRLRRQAGFATTYLIHSARKWNIEEFRDERIAEYAVLDQLAVAAAAVLLILPVMMMWIGGAISRLRRVERPLWLFIGWKRLMRTVLVSVIAPLAAYLLYVFIFRSREYGLHVALTKSLVEYAALACAMVISMRVSGDRALRERGRELGLQLPSTLPNLRAMKIIGALLAMAVVAFLIAWPIALRRSYDIGLILPRAGLILSGLISLYAVAWMCRWDAAWLKVKGRGLRRALPDWALTAGLICCGAFAVLAVAYVNETSRWRNYFLAPLVASTMAIAIGFGGLLAYRMIRRAIKHPDDASFAGSRVRAAVPASAIVAVVLLSTAGLGARWVEKRNVARLGLGPIDVVHEVDQSKFLAMRDQLAAEAN